MPIKKTKTVKAKAVKRVARVPMVNRLRARAALAKKKALARLGKTKATLAAVRANLAGAKKYIRVAMRENRQMARKLARIAKTVK